jgi:type IV pilus assembly protein PilE
MTPRPPHGFTLIELMIGVLIVSILTAVALPTWSEYVARTRRHDARTALMQASQWMERFRAENRGVYTGAALPPGHAVSPVGGGTPVYDIALADVTAATFTLAATARAGGPMASDPCAALTLAHDGLRTAAGVGSGPVFDRCWTR